MAGLIGLALLAFEERDQTLELIRSLKEGPLQISDFIVGIDKRNADGLGRYLDSIGEKRYLFNVYNGFAEARNRGLRKLNTEWIITLAPDEWLDEVDQGVIRKVLMKIDPSVDGISLPRRHWFDLERNKEWKYPYPDRHIKLFRNKPGIKYEGLVHEGIVGCRKVIRLNNDVHHFNMFYDRKKQSRSAKEALYALLSKEQHK